MRRSRDLLSIYAAAFLRALGVGLLGVVLGVYLFRLGLDSTRIGLVIAAGLAGGTLATALVTMRGDRIGRRRVLGGLALLACAGGVGLAVVPSFAGLLALAFLGMLNGMGTDRSAAFALEQAIIPGLVSNRNRTWTLSWYNVLLDGGGALGALAGALPLVLQSRTGMDLTHAYRWVFFGYAALQLLSAGMYLRLSRGVEVHDESAPPRLPTPGEGSQMRGNAGVSTETKTIVRRLTALFALDAFGGGFLGDALVAYWFFRRFGVDEHTLGALFFGVHLLNAASHVGAAWLSRRIGLVKTMVFTHLPSSVLLIAVPFAPSLKLAVALFLARESLVEMDVPTRQSYVAAVVKPQERTFASGVTNLSRNVSWAAASSVAGALMQHLAFSAPLVLGGSMKIIYDLLLYRGFRHLKAPEEQHASAEPATIGSTHQEIKELAMRATNKIRIMAVLLVALAAIAGTVWAQAKPEGENAQWKAVEAAMNRPGKLQPDGVYKFAMPRKDLKVTLDGTAIKPALALGSWVAFEGTRDHAMVMGDLVLTEAEVEPVMMKLQQEGIQETAVHNHLLRENPRVLYMHIEGRGDAINMAKAIHDALALTKTPPADAGSAPAQEQTLGINTTQIEGTLGHKGKVNGGVFQVSVPRQDKITDQGMEVPPSMGTAIALNFQPTGNGRAAITGDFVLLPDEVNPVLKALRDNGIQVMALHSHMLNDQPHLLFMHFWANDDAGKLARGLRAALDQTKAVGSQQALK